LDFVNRFSTLFRCPIDLILIAFDAEVSYLQKPHPDRLARAENFVDPGRDISVGFFWLRRWIANLAVGFFWFFCGIFLVILWDFSGYFRKSDRIAPG